MAIPNTSSLNAAASKQQKPQINDLMETIKSATMKQAKDPFKNLLVDISTSTATQIKEEVATQKSSTDPIATKYRDHPSTQETEEGNSTFISKESEFDKKEKSTNNESLAEDTDNHGSQEPHPTMLPINITSEVSFKEPASQQIYLTVKDQEIKNWINEGRVIIEQHIHTDIPEQNLQTIPTVASQINDIKTQSSEKFNIETLEQATTSINPDPENNQSDPINKTIEATGKFKELAVPALDSQSNRPNTATAINQITPIASSLPQQQETTMANTGSKNKTLTNIQAIQSSQAENGIMRSSKTQKAATLTAYDKLAALNQLKDQLRQSLKKGETHLNIQLKPYELGKVEIKLDITREGMVSALFKAENRETLEILNRHSQDFHNLFQDAGLQTDSQGMNFSMSQEEKMFSEQSHVTKNNFNPTDEIEIAPTPQVRHLSSTSSIDISV